MASHAVIVYKQRSFSNIQTGNCGVAVQSYNSTYNVQKLFSGAILMLVMGIMQGNESVAFIVC